MSTLLLQKGRDSYGKGTTIQMETLFGSKRNLNSPREYLAADILN